MPQNPNPLLCKPTDGICETPTKQHNTDTEHTNINTTTQKPIKVVYYTDPICSACWAIEPQLRKLKLEYAHILEIEYRMGGLLPDWSYNSGGISKPSDVAHHWDEMSSYYDMPIDGDVWLEDPLDSSYPPSIAFKAAQLQGTQKAMTFMRTIREMVFMQKKNIAQWDNLATAAKMAGLDSKQFQTDFEGKAKERFQQDLQLGRQLEVRGFPTLFFCDTNNNKTIRVYGSKPYEVYQNAILQILPNASPFNYDKSWQAVFAQYPSLTAKEFAVLTETPRDNCQLILDNLVTIGILSRKTIKNGSIWTIVNKDTHK